MTRTTARVTALASAVFLMGVFAACGKKENTIQDTTSAGTMTVAVDSAPIRVSDIQVGKRLGSDQKVSDQTTSFGVRDTMYVAVITDGAAKDAKLTTKWTFNNGQTVKENTETISPTGGTNATSFHVERKTAWPKGKYKVEVMLNGVSAGAKDIEVK